MKWKIGIYASIILVILILTKWIADSADYRQLLVYSRDKKPVVTKTTDDLFGTETLKTEWKEGFWLGLLPGDDTVSFWSLLGAVPLSGIFIICAILFWLIHRRFKC